MGDGLDGVLAADAAADWRGRRRRGWCRLANTADSDTVAARATRSKHCEASSTRQAFAVKNRAVAGGLPQRLIAPETDRSAASTDALRFRCTSR